MNVLANFRKWNVYSSTKIFKFASQTQKSNMNYSALNKYLGWLVFIIATAVYFITIEDTVSLWDCGEYITAAYKLEVGHPPGAPLFMLFGRLFSFFADPENAALWINRMSALSSSFTLLFMFWTITMLGKKIALKDDRKMSSGQAVAILGSGIIGALAYTFTESFWFSAVEGEVYAMSSLFTAVIFWAVMKWDEETTAIKFGELDPSARPLKWIVLIFFLFGLAIGVHLLGILVIPCIAYVIYFNHYKDVKFGQFIAAGAVGLFVLGFVQAGLIPGTISLASSFEVFFRNSVGLPFTTGAIIFFILLVAALIIPIIVFRKNKIVKVAMMSLIVMFIGYGSFTTIVIRSNANTPLDENNPENLVTLHAYLKREQYGSWPIVYGQYWNSKEEGGQFENGTWNPYANTRTWDDRSSVLQRRFLVDIKKGKNKTFRDEEAAIEYAEKSGKKNYSIEEKYVEINTDVRKNQIARYSQGTIFPRMFISGDARREQGYKSWSGYDPNRRVSSDEKGKDGKPIPTFGNNLQYFGAYQVNWMYWRYFMWNFAGRQNDVQGHGSALRGNWKSGFDFIDEQRLGAVGENEIYFSKENPSNNKFFYLPFILGLIGLFFHFLKAPKDAFVVTLLFLLTGLAIVIYLNQKPYEPRERDYAFAASFYAFAIWVGLGVYGLYEAFASYGRKEYMKLGIIFGAMLFLCAIIGDSSSPTGMPITMSWLIIGLIGIGSMGVMTLLRKVVQSKKSGGILATTLGLIVPIIMGMQGWDDHDRSERTGARDLAYNYLVACEENSILYTNGDNDTFPLWYLQEVEGKSTDVRVCNLSLMQTDWYTEQMMMKAYESEPLPIKFTEDQILMYGGNTDQVYFFDYNMFRSATSSDELNKIMNSKIENNKAAFRTAINQYRTGMAQMLSSMKVNNNGAIIQSEIARLMTPLPNPTLADFNDVEKTTGTIFQLINAGTLEGSNEIYQQLQTASTTWKKSWDYLPIDIAMEYVRNDDNFYVNRDRKIRHFPAKGFIVPVNTANAVKSGVIDSTQVNDCVSEIRFAVSAQAISREEVMMMDIMANNDWERAIYYSSPAGSTVSNAIYRAGHLKLIGMVYELSPLNSRATDEAAREKMFNNMMEVFKYGSLEKEGTLADYYVRRHTDQYRGYFAQLAGGYAGQYGQAEAEVRAYTQNLDQMKAAGAPTSQVDSIQKIVDAANARMDIYQKKAKQVIDKSLVMLPIKNVFDMSEPRATGKMLTAQVQETTDGVVPSYIQILYRTGNIEAGNKLAIEYLDQLETYVNYFENSPAYFAQTNMKDFIAATSNILDIYAISNGMDDEGIAAKASKDLYSKLYTEVIPQLVEEINQKSKADVSDRRRGSTSGGKLSSEAADFQKAFTVLESGGQGIPQ